MFKYRTLLNRMKGIRSALIAIEDVWAFVTPVAVSFVYSEFIKCINWHNPLFVGCVVWAVMYVVYLACRVMTTYRISNDKLDAYREDIMEQIDGVTINKYHMLCREIHFASRQGKDILIYDAHGVISDILIHVKQLVSSITGVPLSDISVNFIYKYTGNGEHWQTIDGSSGNLITDLDDMVEREQTMYHYLYANNREYVFFNDKAEADWHIYSPSLRDGDNKSSWGSIYCRRILCTMYQERFVDGILSISTYSEKFIRSKHNTVIRETEGLINEAVSAFANTIRCEMAALYIRHGYIKQREIDAVECLIKAGYIEEMDEDGNVRKPAYMTEADRRIILREGLPKFKAAVYKSNSSALEFDAVYDSYTEAVLKNAAIQKMKKNKGGKHYE